MGSSDMVSLSSLYSYCIKTLFCCSKQEASDFLSLPDISALDMCVCSELIEETLIFGVNDVFVPGQDSSAKKLVLQK